MPTAAEPTRKQELEAAKKVAREAAEEYLLGLYRSRARNQNWWKDAEKALTILK